MAIAAIAALALALVYLTRPVQAVATTNIYLQASQQGSDSTTFGEESDCGPFTTGVVWHFILNNFDANTPDGTLTAQFQTAADVTVSTFKSEQNVQHFYVNTPTDDVLDNAYATIELMSGQVDAKLVLSHVCHTGQEPTPTPVATPTPTPVATPTPTPVAGTPTPTPVAGTPTPTPESQVEAATPTPTPEGQVEAATGSPQASTPNTAFGIDASSPAMSILFAFVMLAGLAALAFANVRTARRR